MMEDKFFDKNYSPIVVPGEMAHASYKEFALADANTIGGVPRVEKSEDVRNIPVNILRNNGYRVYVTQEDVTYKLKDISKHDDLKEGWVREITVDIPTDGPVSHPSGKFLGFMADSNDPSLPDVKDRNIGDYF